MDDDRSWSAFRIALYYALFGAAWIFFSDMAAETVAASAEQLRRIQTAKGWLFILASAALIYLLVRLHDRRRRAALDAARESERRMRRAQRIGRLGNWEYDLETEDLYWSPEVCEIFGVEPGGFAETREAFYELVHPDDLAGQEAAERALMAGEGPLDHQHRIVRPDGEVRHVHERAVLECDEDGEPVRMSGTMQDVTERARLAGELKRSRARLERYSGHLIESRDRERRALAREMHDELGQTLTALRIQLGQLRDAIFERAAEDVAAGSAAKVETSLALAEDAMQQVSSIVTGLRPGVLDELGLVNALRHLAYQHEEKTPNRVVVELTEEDPGLGRERALHVYRVAQEALTNVARHADATTVRISLAVDDGELELVVADDGRGLDPDSLDFDRSHGLVGIEERAYLLGGRVRMEESAAGGLAVRLTAPLEGRSVPDRGR